MNILNFIITYASGFASLIIISLLVAGILLEILAKFTNFIPAWGMTYAPFMKVTGIILLILGVWLKGGYDMKKLYQEKIDKLNNELIIKQAESKNLNDQLQLEIALKQQVIETQRVITRTRIIHDADKINHDCKSNPTINQILNDAAKMPQESK